MKNIDFLTLYSTDYNIGNICALRQLWRDGFTFCMKNPRPTCALLLFRGSSATYTSNSGTSFSLFVPKGSIVFIPEGATYDCTFSESEPSSTLSDILLEFSLFGVNGKKFIPEKQITVLTEASPLFYHLFSEMAELYAQTLQSFSCMKSTLYKILSELSQIHRRANIYSKEYASIADGILYMESNINPTMTIEEIADMCHVSPSTFRRLFKKYSGLSPIDYRTNSKIVYAKKLLQSKAMSIAEISDELQFESSAYFCRTFKKNTGMTPGEYSKMF